MKETYTEAPQPIEVYDKCDVLVVGSGAAGHSAAIAAEVRGFNLRTRQSGYKDYPLHTVDYLAMALCALLLAASIALVVLG